MDLRELAACIRGGKFMSMESENGWSSGPEGPGEVVSEHVGFLERLWQSITGILVGLGLIAAVIWGIFWNEGRAIGTTRALNEGAGVTVSVPSARVDGANEGRLIHTTGDLRGAMLADDEFQVRAQGVRLVRKVEMYQWKEEQRTETRSNAGGSQTRTTTYHYSRVWSDRPIDSSRFRQRDGHQNPAMPVTSRSSTADTAMLGAFRADSRVIGLFGSSDERKLDLTPAQIAPFATRFAGRARINDGGVYVGFDPANPNIGDLRITYTLLPEGLVSVIGRQVGNGLQPYMAANGYQVFLGATGTRAASELYAGAHEANRLLTWILRGLAFVVMWIGFNLILRPFVVLADVIPILGSAMAAGAGLVAFALTLLVYLPTIAIAWFWHRPVMSVVLIVAGLVGAYGLKVLGERRRVTTRATAPASVAMAQPAYAGMPQGYASTAGHVLQQSQAQPVFPQQGHAPQGYPQQDHGQQAYPQQPASGQAPPQGQPGGFLNVPPGIDPRRG
jgi:hypothetical protein